MLGQIMEINGGLSSNIRKPLGLKMMSLSYDIVYGINNLSSCSDIVQSLSDLKKKVDELLIDLNILRDNKQIQTRSFVTCNEQIIALGNRLDNLLKVVK